MGFIQDYIEAFQACYPHTNVKVQHYRNGFRVLIDGDAGDIILTEGDLRSATRNFRAGKHGNH